MLTIIKRPKKKKWRHWKFNSSKANCMPRSRSGNTAMFFLPCSMFSCFVWVHPYLCDRHKTSSPYEQLVSAFKGLHRRCFQRFPINTCCRYPVAETHLSATVLADNHTTESQRELARSVNFDKCDASLYVKLTRTPSERFGAPRLG